MVKLEEKEEMFWGRHDTRIKYMFPVDSGTVWVCKYREPLKDDGARVIEHSSVLPRKESILDLFQIAKESNLYLGVGVSDEACGDESLYVFSDGLPQALLASVFTPSSRRPGYRQEHAVVEIREGYDFGKELLAITLEHGQTYLPLKLRSVAR